MISHYVIRKIDVLFDMMSEDERDAALIGDWDYEQYDVCDEIRDGVIELIKEERG